MIWATLVLAQSVPADVGGGLLGGAGGALVGGAGIWWLIRHHADQMEKARVSFAGEMKDARDDFSGKIDVLTEKFESALSKKDEQITSIVNKFDTALRDMRAENQRNVERQFEHSREVVAALEHVNTALHELSGRVDVLDGSKTHPALPTQPPPPPARPRPRPQPPRSDPQE